MTDRSGCGLAELTILHAVVALSTGREEAPSVKVLDEVDRRIGLGPSYAYPMLCDLTKPWVIPLPLLAISGNAGDRTFPQAPEPVHTECRLSRALRHLIDDPQLPDSQLLRIAGGPISATHSELTGDFEALAGGLRITKQRGSPAPRPHCRPPRPDRPASQPGQRC